MSAWTRWLLRAAFPVLIVGAWEALVRARLLPPSQSAAPSTVVTRLVELLATGELLRHAAISLARLLAGVTAGSLAGVATALPVTLSRRLALAVAPTLRWLAGVPVVLWIPFCVMLLGTGEAYKIGITAIASFFLVFTGALDSARATARVYLEVADVYEKTLTERIWDVVLPSATSAIISSIRAALVFGWVVLFFVEYASSQEGREGLGWFVADARQVGRVEEEFAGLLLLAMVAYAIDRVIAAYQRWRDRWRGAADATAGELA